MAFRDFIVSKQVGFQAFFMTRLWDSSGIQYFVCSTILMWQYRSQNRFRIQALHRTGREWLFFILLICVSNTPDAGELYRGLYVGGFEHSDFMPCGIQERWWLQGEAYAQIQAAVMEKGRTPRNTDWTLSTPVYVELRGSLSEPGRYGHMGAYSRQLNAQKLIYLSFTNQCNNK